MNDYDQFNAGSAGIRAQGSAPEGNAGSTEDSSVGALRVLPPPPAV